MQNAITVRAVMAFSLLAGAAHALAATDNEFTWGVAKPCEMSSENAHILAIGPDSRLLAAYIQETMEPPFWLRVVQRGKRFTIETSASRARRDIDPALAERIHSSLAGDLSHDAFIAVTDEIQIDGVWYTYTADGTTCQVVPWMSRNDRAREWIRFFETLFTDTSTSKSLARFWLDHLERKPATLPTSLEGARAGQDVPGAGSTWTSSVAPPLLIVNHRARIDGHEIEIVGEVANHLDSARNDAGVVATFLDSNGNVLATEEEDLEFDLLPTGARAPFQIEADVQGAAAYTLRIEPGDEAKVRPESIRVTKHAAQNEDEDLHVSGTVRNDGKQDESSIEVQVNLYDAAGNLLAGDSDIVGETLRAGASAAFEVWVERPLGYHHYQVLVNPDYREQPR